MYKILITFLNGINYSPVLKNIPIRHKSNGSIVCMKGCDPWLDYINVTYQELLSCLEYVDSIKDVSVIIEKI